MMPDLPNVDFERDVEQFIEFFGAFKSLLELAIWGESRGDGKVGRLVGWWVGW